MDYVSVAEDFFNSHIPEVILLVGGILALLIIHYYRKDEDAGSYKALLAVGVVVGVMMIAMTFSQYAKWTWFTSLIIIMMAFTMIVRPFRKVEIAVFIGLITILVAYLLLGRLSGVESLVVLSEGWPRLVVAFVIGALVYMIANFAEKIVMLFGKLLNWWPFMAILAVLCIVEAVCLLATGKSIYPLMEELLNGTSSAIMLI